MVEKVISDADMSYHQQDYDGYCGSASAQMALQALSPSNSLTNLQSTFYEPIRASSSYVWSPDITWYAAPEALASIVQAQNTGTRTIEARGFWSGIDATVFMMYHINTYDVPGIALVYGYQHWIVVRGYTANDHPSTPTDPLCDPETLDLYDPWPPAPESMVKPINHTAGDSCGIGYDRGAPLNNVSYEEWRWTGGYDRTGYLTGVPSSVHSRWQGQFVVVSDPPNNSFPQPSKPEREDTPKLHESGPIIDKQIVKAKVKNELQHVGLSTRRGWENLLAATQPGEPKLVERLDSPGTFYYIVPFEIQQSTPLAIRVSAHSLRYLQAIGMRKVDQNVIRIISNDHALEAVEAAQSFKFGNIEVAVTRQLIEEPDKLQLVWKPCMESFSPFCPFYRVVLKSVEGYALYVRAMDGKVFASLTTRSLGGI